MLNLDRQARDYESKADERKLYNTTFDEIVRYVHGTSSITRRLGHEHTYIAKIGLRDDPLNLSELAGTYFPQIPFGLFACQVNNQISKATTR